jgi:hypothetical protein
MTLTLELSPEEESRLALASRLHGTDPATYAKQLVTEHLPPLETEAGDFDGRSVYEVFGHLFGGVEGLPSDLSTNPKYMEGFGETKAVRTFES